MSDSGQPLYLGVDAGGTFTRSALLDAHGTVLARGAAGAANHRTTARSEARAAVRTAIAEALTRLATPGQAPIARVRAVAIGWSGLEEPGTEAEARAIVGDAVAADLVVLDSDVMAAHVGAFAGGPGALVSAGTGSIALAVDADGGRTRVGGWGHRFGDEGSAAWIGTEGIRAALRGLDGRDPATALWVALRAHAAIEASPPDDAATMQRVTAWLYDPARHLNDVADFARAVDHAAELGDAAAIAVLERAGAELAHHVERASRALATLEPLPVAGAGGVWTGSARVREACRAAVAARLVARAVHWQAPLADAAVGAAWMAIRADGRGVPRTAPAGPEVPTPHRATPLS